MPKICSDDFLEFVPRFRTDSRIFVHFTFVQKCTQVFRTYLGTFWRTILTSIITWFNYIFTYLPKYEIERIIE